MQIKSLFLAARANLAAEIARRSAEHLAYMVAHLLEDIKVRKAQHALCKQHEYAHLFKVAKRNIRVKLQADQAFHMNLRIRHRRVAAEILIFQKRKKAIRVAAKRRLIAAAIAVMASRFRALKGTCSGVATTLSVLKLMKQ